MWFVMQRIPAPGPQKPYPAELSTDRSSVTSTARIPVLPWVTVRYVPDLLNEPSGNI